MTLVGLWVRGRLLHLQAVTLGRCPSSSPGDSLGTRTTCLVGLGGVPEGAGPGGARGSCPERTAAVGPGSALGDGTACAEQSWQRQGPAHLSVSLEALGLRAPFPSPPSPCTRL